MPKLYNVVADALLWIIMKEGEANGINYQDDFLLFGAPHSPQCAVSLTMALRLCGSLGVPIAPGKTENPTTKLVLLEIELDTATKSLSLTKSKLADLLTTIQQWGDKHSCTKKELLSLIGRLQHACCVIWPGFP